MLRHERESEGHAWHVICVQNERRVWRERARDRKFPLKVKSGVKHEGERERRPQERHESTCFVKEVQERGKGLVLRAPK